VATITAGSQTEFAPCLERRTFAPWWLIRWEIALLCREASALLKDNYPRPKRAGIRPKIALTVPLDA